jgi:ADP-ribose pyrophosphatase YjhB (NUDIX family)
MVLQGCPDEEPSWAVPGGSIEPGEPPEQAAIREVKEETGLEVRIVCLYAVVEGMKEYGAYRVHYFQGDIVGGKAPKTSGVLETSEVLKVVGGEAKAGDPDGLIHRVAWVPADRLPDLRLSHEDQRQVLMEFMGVS